MVKKIDNFLKLIIDKNEIDQERSTKFVRELINEKLTRSDHTCCS